MKKIYEQKKKIYEQNLKSKKEERTIDDGKHKFVVEYNHYPNAVGPRSKYTGLPIWVGKTIARGPYADDQAKEVVAKCWTDEPFDYDQARFIATGRLLKALGLPTSLADQVKESDLEDIRKRHG